MEGFELRNNIIYIVFKRIAPDTLWRIDLRKTREEAWRLIEKLIAL